MSSLMYDPQIASSIVSIRNAYARQGHVVQMEFMLKREISFVDHDISRAEYIENAVYHNTPLSAVCNWKNYERDYYKFVKQQLGDN